MDDRLAVRMEGVAKKYSRFLRRSMYYGISDIARNMFGMSSRSDRIRPGEFWALQNISLEIRRGQCLGLIGPNGSGKSTLLKLLNGIFWPDQGRIVVRGKTGALIEVGAGFHPLLTGRENIFVNAAILGMSRREAEQRFDRIVDFADIGDFLDTPVKSYSSGMFVRLGFAVAAHCDPDILLLDEVLAVGDAGFQAKCFERIAELRRVGTTVVVVSHNMHLISSFADSVFLLQDGRGRFFDDVGRAVLQYNRSFPGFELAEIERISTGSEGFEVLNVNIPRREIPPGDSFEIELEVQADRHFEDVEIDTVIMTAGVSGHLFQASNRAYGKRIDITPGRQILCVAIEQVRVNGAAATVVIAVSKRGRTGYLFWWRVPILCREHPFSTGRCFLDVTYEQRKV